MLHFKIRISKIFLGSSTVNRSFQSGLSMKYCATFFFVLFLASSCASNQEKEKKYATPAEKKAELHYSHGTEKLVKKDYTLALNHLLKAVNANEKDPKIHNNLGMTYYFKGKLDMAIKHLKRSSELDPENFDALNNIASIYYKQGRYELAKSQYQKVLTNLHYPHQYRTHYNMALLHLREGSEFKARNQLAASIAENKDYCPAYFLLGKLEYEIKNYNSAFENFHKSGLGTCFSEPAPIFWKAKTLIKQNKLLRADQMFREIIKKFPSTAYSRKAAVELRDIERRESLANKVNRENFRYNQDEKPLQSKQEIETIESPSF